MTREDDHMSELADALRALVAARARTTDAEVRDALLNIGQLPPKRHRRSGLWLAGIAAALIAATWLGLAVLPHIPLGDSGAWAPSDDPAASGSPDPCLAAAATYSGTVAGAFPTTVGQIRRFEPSTPERWPDLPADHPAVLCYIDGQIPLAPPPDPGGGAKQPFDRAVVAVVDGAAELLTAGYRDRFIVPAPFPPADEPWIARCATDPGQVAVAFPIARARDIWAHLPAFGRAPELQVDDPAFAVVYLGTHPLPPGGAPPAPGATVMPRDPLAPGHHDICVLVGADPASAELNVYENVDTTGMLTSIPDPIPGAWDLTQTGFTHPKAGRVVPLDQL